MSLITLIGLLMLSSAGLPAGADNVFVSPGGSGSSCTDGSPCSVSTGQLQADNGDIIVFKHGTYGWFDTTKAGITYKAQERHQAIISNGSGRPGSSQGSTIMIRHDNTTIDGLRISGEGTAGGSHGTLRWQQGVSGTIVRNSIIEDSSGGLLNVCGSHSSNCSDILIEDNIIRNAGLTQTFGEGVYIAQFQGANTVDGVIVRRNTVQGFSDQAIDVKPGATNVEIYHNIFELQDDHNNPNTITDGVIVVSSDSGDVTIHDNIIRNNDLTGTSGSSVLRPTRDGMTVRDNVLYGNQHNGFLIRHRSGGSGVATEIFENVFCDNSNNTIESGVGFNVRDNVSHAGAHQDCTDKENEILALIGGEPPEPPPPPLHRAAADCYN